MANVLTLSSHYRILMHDARTGRLLSDDTYPNLVCQPGKNYIAAWLNQEGGYAANPTIYGAVGTSSVAVTGTETQLGAEVARSAMAVQTRLLNVLTWSFVLTATQGNVSQQEVGIFLGGTTVANSGSLLSRVLQVKVKDVTMIETVQYILTVG